MKNQLYELCGHVIIGTNWYKLSVLAIVKLNPKTLIIISKLNEDSDFKIFKMFELWLSSKPDAIREEKL